MRKRLTWLLVTLGIAALVRRLKRSGGPAEPAPAGDSTEDPADELRRKLAESRSTEESAPTAPETTVEERRAQVHDHGRAALDDMRSSDEEQ